MKLRACVCAAASFVCWALQPASAQERPLTLLTVRDVPGVFQNPVFPAKCGREKELYVRIFNGSSNIPPTRISPDAKEAKTFGLDNTPYSKKAHIWDFAPGLNGEVFELIWLRINDQGGYRLLRFDREGKLLSDNSITAPFDPLQIAVLGNGQLVIAGRKANELGGHKGDPGIGIINDRGQFISSLKLKKDLVPPKEAQQTTDDMPSEAQEEYNYAIDLSIASSADDGNVYVLRQSATGPIIAISPDGQLKEISLPPRGEGIINSALVSHGHVLVHYVERSDRYRQTDTGIFSEYNLSSVEKVADYKADGPLTSNNMPGCYSPDEVTFLKIAPKGRLSLLSAKPQ